MSKGPLRGESGGVPASLTSFIGREAELDAILGLLHTNRLITVTGVGGVGKTRLAAEVARRCRASFEDDVLFINLEHADHPLHVWSAIDDALRVDPAKSQRADRRSNENELFELVASTLKGRSALLVLDTFERVLGAGPAVAELLRRSDQLHVLITSRSLLRLQGERRFPLVGFRLPSRPQTLTVEEALRLDAVRLFVDRANRGLPDFMLSEQNVDDVVRVCHRLQGIPLGLELAASRTRALSPREIANALDHQLEILSLGSRDAPRRHRTMRAALAWSYGLLNQPQRAALAQLSIFTGGWTLAAAEAVCQVDLAQGAVTSVLQDLVDHSLVEILRTTYGETRFHMLDVVREYAAERLADSGEVDRVASRHRAFFLSWSQDRALQAAKADPADWWERASAESGNLRAALGPTALEDTDPASVAGVVLYGRHYAPMLVEVRADDIQDSDPKTSLLLWQESADLALLFGDFDQVKWASFRIANLAMNLGDLDLVERSAEELIRLAALSPSPDDLRAQGFRTLRDIAIRRRQPQEILRYSSLVLRTYQQPNPSDLWLDISTILEVLWSKREVVRGLTLIAALESLPAKFAPHELDDELLRWAYALSDDPSANLTSGSFRQITHEEAREFRCGIYGVPVEEVDAARARLPETWERGLGLSVAQIVAFAQDACAISLRRRGSGRASGIDRTDPSGATRTSAGSAKCLLRMLRAHRAS